MEDSALTLDRCWTPRLTIPRTRHRLFHPVTTHFLTEGEEISTCSYHMESSWRTAKHVDAIKELPDIGNDAKDYIIKWDFYTTPLRLSCNLYVPRVLIGFIETHRGWFAERRGRVRECSLHATALRLRRVIDMDCFTECITLLQECNILHKALEETSWKNNMMVTTPGSRCTARGNTS